MVGAVASNVHRALGGIGLLGFVIIMRLFFFGAAVGTTSASHTSDIAQEFGLSSYEVKAYSACQYELSRSDMNFRGSMTAYCGCFAKRATVNLNDGYKNKAAAYFRAYSRAQKAPSNPDTYFTLASYQGIVSTAEDVAKSVRRAGNSCTEEAVQNSRRY